MEKSFERALGRRKTATAQVRLSAGAGTITVNTKPMNVYFPLKRWQEIVRAPFMAIGRADGFDASIKVRGGGVQGQAEAVRHGIARALVRWNAELRPVLKAQGFLTRDPRAKERKHFGLHKARRGHQWRKR